MKYFYFLLILFFTSCIEIIEDIKFNKDGSGTFKYTINLSYSKVKVASILALDSLNGYKVPKNNDIKNEVSKFKKTLKSQEGISNVVVHEDYENYILKIQCDFQDVEKLESALKETFKVLNKNKDYDYDWISFKQNTLKRKTPIFYIEEIKNFGINDVENLKKGSYTSITRFGYEIDTFENPLSLRSKNNLALMIKTTPNLLLTDQTILNNKIILKR